MKIMRYSLYVACTAAAILLAGCETPTVKPDQQSDNASSTRPAVIVPPKETPEQIAAKQARLAAESSLNEAIAVYDGGDYNGLIKRLSAAPDYRPEDKDLQIRALKYMAFSYCVTNRQTLCRQHFDKILKLDPAFDLAPGEKGHPQWQAAFDRVKKTQK